jgi:hypothetical protein
MEDEGEEGKDAEGKEECNRKEGRKEGRTK